MLQIKITLLFLLLCFLSGFSQKGVPIQWGKIPPKDLQMTVYEQDTTAEAVVLCNYGKISVEDIGREWKYRFTHHKRIKILKKSGFDYGEIVVPFYHHNKAEGISPIKARVVAPDGTVTDIGKKDIFKEKVNEYYSASKVALPNIQVGSVIEYTYKILSDRIVFLRDWYFQEEIPTRLSKLEISFPNYFVYNYIFQGSEFLEQKKEENYTIYEGGKGTIKIGEGWFTMENAVAFKEPESYITTLEDYIAKIQFQLSQVNYPDGRKEAFLSTWEELAKDMEHRESFGEQFLKKRNHKKILEATAPLISSTKTQKETAQVLYDYFNTNVEWNGKHRYWVETSLNETFEKKTAYSGELNLMLLVALKATGITAHPLTVSTRSHGRMQEEYPLATQFDHVIVYAMLDGKGTLLDLGDPLLPMGMPNSEALNSKGWLLDFDNPQIIQINPAAGMDVFSVQLTLDEEGIASGLFKGAYKGYNAMPERRSYKKDTTGKHWYQRLEEKYPEFELENLTFKNLDDVDQAFREQFDLNIPEAAQAVGDFIYFSPVLFSQFEENMFKLEKRYYPVDIPYPFSEHYIMTLTIPEDYEIEDLPESAKFVLPNKGGSFSFIIEQKNDTQIQLVSKIKITQLKYAPYEYPGIKELFDLVSEKYGEQIVLKKRT